MTSGTLLAKCNKNAFYEQNLGTYTGNFLFVSEEDIFVTRAPGRLDVMGGIADYSGSLVLQVP